MNENERPERDTDWAPAPTSPARRRAVVVAGALTAALLVWFGAKQHRSARHLGEGAFTGRVVDVAESTPGGAGLECCSPDGAVCRRVQPSEPLPAGSVLRTDRNSRAVVEMKDGSRFTLDRNTELDLDGHFARRARLDHGAMVIAVPALGAGGARFDVPFGFAEVHAATASLVAGQDRTQVEVLRGSLRLVDRSEHGVVVHAGDGASVDADHAPTAYVSARVGARVHESERAFIARREEAPTPSGLGELLAKKPGEDRERADAVKLASHSTRVRIVGGFARTEIDEVFTNQTDDVLEGIYRFPLPPGAEIERLALDVDGRLEDGAFVDKDRAMAIWRGAIVNAGDKKKADEEIVWVPGPWRDPALLEWQRGGQFELRVYPIPRHGSRRVVIAYTEVVAPAGNSRSYVYPLPFDPSGGARIGHFDMEVEIRGNDPKSGVRARGYDLRQEQSEGGVTSLNFAADGFAPSGDLSVEYDVAARPATAWAYQPSPDEVAVERAASAPAASAPGAVVPVALPSTSDESAGAPYVAIALRPALPRAEDHLERAVALVVDSSRSMFGERYRRATAVAARLAGELDRDDTVTVLACDSSCRAAPGVLHGGAEAERAVSAFLRGVTPEGGSDVAAAIRHGRDALGSVPAGSARVVYVGDGTPTIGSVSPALMRHEIAATAANGAAVVSTVAIGSEADMDTLATISEAGGGVTVPYAPGAAVTDVADAMLGAIYGEGLSEPSVELPAGLSDVAPRRIPTIAAGAEMMLFARMTAPVVDGSVTLRGKVGSVLFEAKYPLHIEATTAKGNAFVPRLWAGAKLAELEKEPDLASRKRAVELSGRFHVGSRYTSLLVLESAAMYRAFGLDHEQKVALWTGDLDATSTGSDDALDVAAPDNRTGLAAPADFERGKGSAQSGAANGFAKDESADAPEREKASPAKAQRAAPEPARAYEKAASNAYAEEGGYAPPPLAAAAPAMPSPMPATPPYSSGAGRLGSSGGALELRGPGEQDVEPRYIPELPRGRRMIPMRKVWDRVGRIVTPVTLPNGVTAVAIERAEADVRANELRRDALKHLYTLYFLGGNLDRAGEVSEQWSTKDPLDPDALTARADVAAARGERELAIRILGSVVDVRPGDHKAQWRLARLHRWAGRPELGCRHSMAVAQIRANDPKLLAEAVRCARDLGESAVASELEAGADEPTERAAEALLALPATDPFALSGDLRVEATWDGGDDLDVSMLPPDGNRVSWLGAPTRAIISARDVLSRMHEGLALRGGLPGDYVIEITRPEGHSGTVRGTIDIDAAGERRTVPFVLDGPSVRVALAKITTQMRLVPL